MYLSLSLSLSIYIYIYIYISCQQNQDMLGLLLYVFYIVIYVYMTQLTSSSCLPVPKTLLIFWNQNYSQRRSVRSFPQNQKTHTHTTASLCRRIVFLSGLLCEKTGPI